MEEGPEMRAKELVEHIIGGAEFVLEDIISHAEMNEIILSVHPTRREKCRCGICRRKAPLYDKGRGKRRWRCLDMGAEKCMLRRNRLVYAVRNTG